MDPRGEGRAKAMPGSGMKNDFSRMNQSVRRFQWSERAGDDFKLRMSAPRLRFMAEQWSYLSWRTFCMV